MQISGLALELGVERDVKLVWKDVFLYALSYSNWGKQKKCNTGVKKGKKNVFLAFCGHFEVTIVCYPFILIAFPCWF